MANRNGFYFILKLIFMAKYTTADQITDLVKIYEVSKKPEKFVDTLTNYEHNLRIAIEYKKEFPDTWKEKLNKFFN